MQHLHSSILQTGSPGKNCSHGPPLTDRGAEASQAAAPKPQGWELLCGVALTWSSSEVELDMGPEELGFHPKG